MKSMYNLIIDVFPTELNIKGRKLKLRHNCLKLVVEAYSQSAKDPCADTGDLLHY
jgi:hypothetical protein